MALACECGGGANRCSSPADTPLSYRLLDLAVLSTGPTVAPAGSSAGLTGAVPSARAHPLDRLVFQVLFRRPDLVGSSGCDDRTDVAISSRGARRAFH
jgi:hypothetical protein